MLVHVLMHSEAKQDQTRLSLEQRKAYRWAPTLGATTVTGEGREQDPQGPTPPIVGSTGVLCQRQQSLGPSLWGRGPHLHNPRPGADWVLGAWLPQ